MAEIGFKVKRRAGGPVPDLNDAVWLTILLAAAVFLPLWSRVGAGKAVMISSIYFIAVLVPLLIGAYYPALCIRRKRNIPAVAFPVVAGLAASALGIVVSVVTKSISLGGIEGRPRIDFLRGWSQYFNESYPWNFLVFLTAVLIAWRMRSGTYPDISKVKGYARYQEWGSLRDAAIFLGFTVALMELLIRPSLVRLQPERFLKRGWYLDIIPGIILFLIGFFVPTWYRANALRIEKEGEMAKQDRKRRVAN